VYYQSNLEQVFSLLEEILILNAQEESFKWLKDQQEHAFSDKSDFIYFKIFSSIPRYFTKDQLQLTPDLLERIKILRKNWYLSHWSVDQAARIFLLLMITNTRQKDFKKIFLKLYATANIQELVTLYQSLPLLPAPQDFILQAAEGIRSNMTSVFNAIALYNQYPFNFFNQEAWNQMILKALFIGADISHIVGINIRANPTLASMLIDYAFERISAKRPVKSDLWYLVGISTMNNISALTQILKNPNREIQQGAALACHYCPLPEAKENLIQYSHLQENIKPNICEIDNHFNLSTINNLTRGEDKYVY